jgi:hypothetical protein
MNQEKLIQAYPPSIVPLLYTEPTIRNATQHIEKTTIDEFLQLSRLYLGLDKNS